MSLEKNSGTCPRCSANVPSGVVFCTQCGKSLESESPLNSESEATQDSVVEEVPKAQTAPSSGPFSFPALSREIEYLDSQYPWNLIALASVWVFLFLTYFI